MRKLTDLKNFQIMRQEVTYPNGDPVRTEGIMVILNNPDLDLTVLKSKNIRLNRNYQFFYMDRRINRKIFNKMVRVTDPSIRKSLYGQVKESHSFLRTPNTFETIKKKSFYYDMTLHNRVFFEAMADSRRRFSTRINEYMKILKDVVHDERWTDHKKIMMIDVQSWGGLNNKFVGKDTYLTSPWMMFYYLMWKDLPKLQELGDIEIFLHTSDAVMKIKPNELTKDDYRRFRQTLKRFSRFTDVPEDLEKEITRYDIISDTGAGLDGRTMSDVRYMTGEKLDTKVVSKTREKIDDVASHGAEVAKPDKGNIKETRKELSTEIDESQEVAELKKEISKRDRGVKNQRSIARDEELRKRHKEIINKTKVNVNDIVIPVDDVYDAVDTTNENVTKVRYKNINKVYNSDILMSDIMDVFDKLQDAEIPMHVIKTEVEDASDELNAIRKIRVTLEDENRVRHTVNFELPIFVDDKFLYLSGNKKIINKQLFMKPVVKTGPAEVQIVSNYNKIFIRRHGARLSKKTEKLRKVLIEKPEGIHVVLGSSDVKNIKYNTTIEYDELSKNFGEIRIKGNRIIFDQQKVIDELKKKNITLKEKQICIGFYSGGKPIIVDEDSQLLSEEKMDIVDYIYSIAPNTFKETYDATKTGKVFMYSQATIMAKNIPIILLLGYVEGLTTVMRKAEIKHRFTDKRPRLDESEDYIQFADGYLIYDRHPMENSLLLNGLTVAQLRAFNYEDMDDPNTYITLFDTLYNQRNIASAFDNFYDFMIDPITEQVLVDLGYPTDFVSLVLFANSLLTTSSYVNENDMSLYRIRGGEILSVYLYKEITDAYGRYRRTAHNNNPVKISIKPDSVVKRVLTEQIIDDYSTLNPVVELELDRAASTKGPSGMNLSEGYTLDKRAYDPSMLGLIGISTSPDRNVGVARQLTLEPNITSARGYIEVKNDKLDELNDANLFSPAELLTPLGATRDDSSRTAMAVKQSKHIIPVEKSTPALITNGSDQVIQYQLSSDFSVTADEDGVVTKIDEDAGIAVITYKSGKYKAIDISNRLINNSAGGFLLENPLEMRFKEGQRFKKYDIIATSKNYFTDDSEGNNRYKVGSLQRVAVMSGYFSLEDSSFITDKMSKELSTDLVISRDIVLGKNSNVEDMVKIGDEVQVGDTLLKFDESYSDESVNQLLANIGSDLEEEITELGKRPIRAKESGTIVDIKVYSTVDKEELSPSLRKIVTQYYTRINKRKRVLDSIQKSKTHGDYLENFGFLETEPTSKIETDDGKVKGNIVGEGVLIQIFVRYTDTMGTGDKLAYFTALKSTVGEIIPKGYEPYVLSDPDEEISTFIAPAAIAARMTPSIILTMLGYRVLVDLKKQVREIFES